MKATNPIIKATVELLRAVHNSESETVEQAERELKAFADSWLVNGEMKPLGGWHSSLSDTDITEGIRDGLCLWIKNEK